MKDCKDKEAKRIPTTAEADAWIDDSTFTCEDFPGKYFKVLNNGEVIEVPERN